MKIRKNGYKTIQNRFRIFPLKFLNHLGQYNSNSIPFETLGSISTSNRRLLSSKNFKKCEKFHFFFCKKPIWSHIMLYCMLDEMSKNIVSNLSTLLLHKVPIVLCMLCVIISPSLFSTPFSHHSCLVKFAQIKFAPTAWIKLNPFPDGINNRF